MFGGGWRIPHDPPDADRHTDQALKPVLTPLVLKNSAASKLPRTFIYCTQGAQDIGPLHLPIAKQQKKQRGMDIDAIVNWKRVIYQCGQHPKNW